MKAGSKIRIRQRWEKLIMAASLKEVEKYDAQGAPQDPVGYTQYFDGAMYHPDHNTLPLVITPVVQAFAPDLKRQMNWSVGTLDNPGIPDKAWKVNGVEIGTAWASQSGQPPKYEFSENGKYLWIKRNLDIDEVCRITCDIVILDTRTDTSIPFTTEEAELSCIAAAEAPVTLQISANIYRYDPMADDLVDYKYRQARNLPQAMSEAEATNDACYLKEVDIIVSKGEGGQMTEGFGLIVADADGTTLATLAKDATEAVIVNPYLIHSLTRTKLIVDCQTIDHQVFKVSMTDDAGAAIGEATQQFEITRSWRDFSTPEITRRAEYTKTSNRYYNSIRVNSNGEQIPYPAAYLNVEYKTQSMEYQTEEEREAHTLIVGFGNDCLFNPNESGGGETEEDNGFLMWAEVDYHQTAAPATDESGDYLVDENGNRLLIS